MIFVTGCYGFLGHFVVARLLADGHAVTGVDRLTHAISEKGERIKALAKSKLQFVEIDLTDRAEVERAVCAARPDVVIHLAAQFPVRHCAAAIESYIASNVTAWLNVAEACRVARVPKMVYASSVVAFGRPSSIYGATKGFADLAAHVYALHFGMSMVGLRFAAVYGPRVRPDSAIYRVANQMVRGKAIEPIDRLHSPMHMIEVGDAVECTVRFATNESGAGASTYLIAADDERASMADIASALKPHLGVAPIFPDGFEPRTRGGRPDLSALQAAIGFAPKTTLNQGMERFARWFRKH
jgi:UDP-glucuronate 4-epimerase